MEERGRGKFSVNHHIVDEACSQVLAHASQQALPGSVFTVARPIGFHVHRQDEVAADHGREHEMMPVAGDFFLGIAVGTAQGASLLSPPPAGMPRKKSPATGIISCSRPWSAATSSCRWTWKPMGRATVNTEPGSACWLACARTWEHASSTMWWLTENLPRPLSSILRERRVGR